MSARTVYVLFCVMTSLYCVLAYIPFTYEQMLKSNLIPQAGAFARMHPAIQAAMTLVLLLDCWRDLRRIPLLSLLVSAQTFAAAACVVRPVLVHLSSNAWSLAAAIVSLLPALILCGARCAMTLTASPACDRRVTTPVSPVRLLSSCILASLAVTVVYGIVAFCLGGNQGDFRDLALAFWIQSVLFLTLFLLLDAVLCIIRAAQTRAFWLFLSMHALLFVAVWRVVLSEFCRPFGFDGAAASIYAGLLALTVTALFALHAVYFARSFDFDALLWPLHFGFARTPLRAAGTLIVFAAAAVWISIRVSQYDWNHMFQHLSTFAFWLIAFSLSWSLTAHLNRVRLRRAHCLAVVFAIIGALKLAEARGLEPLKLAMSSRQQSAALSATLLVPAGGVDQEFFRFLAANTNLPHSLLVKPVNVEFITGSPSSTAAKPNIFIITVDSLRRDYLSSYNSRVTFTPSIGQFAKENLVYQKAFTRYGGTGLSEPSIWAGSLLLHKQYVTPFAPMNTLEKLIRTAGYGTYISRDTILTTLLSSARPGIDVDLDSTTQNMDYDLGRSLRELQSRLEARRSDTRPIFAYTQPQNLHISVMQRQGLSVPAGESYPGFYAPYASRVRMIDAAFGNFIDYLKRSGIYENSIVILTSDHGDSLGEDGRWGHAYTIYPEIVRIPLLIHMPASMVQDWLTDTNAVVFSADITPTLHTVLGYRVPATRPEYGSTFFRTREERKPGNTAKFQFIASSYGAVYGALTTDGSRLFIADAVNYSEYCYDLTATPPAPVQASPEVPEQARAFIRERVNSLARMYGLEGRL